MGTVLPNDKDAFIVYDWCLFYFQFITLHSQKQVPHLSDFAYIMNDMCDIEFVFCFCHTIISEI